MPPDEAKLRDRAAAMPPARTSVAASDSAVAIPVLAPLAVATARAGSVASAASIGLFNSASNSAVPKDAPKTTASSKRKRLTSNNKKRATTKKGKAKMPMSWLRTCLVTDTQQLKRKEAQAKLLEAQANSEKTKQETATMKARAELELAEMKDERLEKLLMRRKRLIDSGAATADQLDAMGLGFVSHSAMYGNKHTVMNMSDTHNN